MLDGRWVVINLNKERGLNMNWNKWGEMIDQRGKDTHIDTKGSSLVEPAHHHNVLLIVCQVHILDGSVYLISLKTHVKSHSDSTWDQTSRVQIKAHEVKWSVRHGMENEIPLLFISTEMYSTSTGSSFLININVPFFSWVENPMMMVSSSVAMFPDSRSNS